MSLNNYKYTATDKVGQQVSGTHKAQTRDQVAEYLQSQGYFVVSITQDLNATFEKLGDIQIGGIPLKDKLVLIKQLSAMMGAGLPVLQSLDILQKQMSNKSIQEQLLLAKNAVEGGSSLSVAFRKNTELFSEVQLNLLSAGEKSGNMVEVIRQIGVDMEKSYQLRSKIRSAMIYPAIIFIAIIVVVAVLIVYMIPAVEQLYRDFNAADQIPDITKFLITFSGFLSSPVGLIIVALIVAGGIITFRSFKATENGRMILARLYLKMPVFGSLIQNIQLAEFGRLLAMLMQSGVPIMEALRIVALALSNPVYTQAVMDTIPEVSKGTPLAIPLAKSGIFPLLYVRMIATAEQTGNLDKILADLGKFYEAEVNEITDNLTKLMEPLILLVVGAIVMFLAVAVYLPIYQIGNVIS